MRSASEKPHGVAEANAAADLGGELLDEREMVQVKTVPQVEGVQRKDVHEVLLRERVGSIEVEQRIARGAGLRGENLVLGIGEDQLRLELEALVLGFETNSSAQRRDAWKRGAGVSELGRESTPRELHTPREQSC